MNARDVERRRRIVIDEDGKVVRIVGRPVADVGGIVDESSATLCVYGEDLEPAEITRLMGVPPSRSFRRGDARGHRSPPAKHGGWLLRVEGTAPAGPEEHIEALLAKITPTKEQWREIQTRHRVCITIGVHFSGWNRGFSLSPETLARVSRLGVELAFDLYADDDDPAA